MDKSFILYDIPLFFFYHFRTANTYIAVTTANNYLNNYLNMEHPNEFDISDSHGFVEICDMPLDHHRRRVLHFELSAIQLLPFMNFALKKQAFPNNSLLFFIIYDNFV